MIFCLIIFLEFSFSANNPSLIYKNNHAVDLYIKEKTLEAQRFLEKKTVDNPEEGILHYNLGVANESLQQKEKAIKEYLSAAKSSQDGELQFKSLFNAAKLYETEKDFKNALKYYQLALEIKPDSNEVKTNIELMFQGGGSGNEDSENQQDKKDDQQQKPKPQDEQNPQQQDKNQSKPQPKPFKSEDLSEQDVKKILEELKRQEEQIRAKMNNQKSKESPVGKDW